ncbi:MAG: asparaginase [Fermentimonas sp.]|jgi:L-asparaginase
MIDSNAKVLIIYTGGTIGMIQNKKTGALEPYSFDNLNQNMPEIQFLSFGVESIQFDPPIDSSDVTFESWTQILRIIEEQYQNFDGFVILHGTDTMAYTASALSFMCENLTKPIILTGSQLPIGKLRTDAKENLITALEIAADKDADGHPLVPEVSIYMQNLLMRGCRATKINADSFSAFNSPNCNYLAETGIDIIFNDNDIIKPKFNEPTKFNYNLDPNVVVLKLFPGITERTVQAILNIEGLKGVVLETYGSGNSPVFPWFMKLVKDAVDRGVVIVSVTQCLYGSAEMYRYNNGQKLENLGVVSGHDMTTEATLMKMITLFGNNKSSQEVKQLMHVSLRGEIDTRSRIINI